MEEKQVLLTIFREHPIQDNSRDFEKLIDRGNLLTLCGNDIDLLGPKDEAVNMDSALGVFTR